MKPHEIIASLRWWRAPGEGMPWLLLAGPWPYDEDVYGRVDRAEDGRFEARLLSFTFGHWLLGHGALGVSERIAKQAVLEAAEAAIVDAAKYYAEKAVAYANNHERNRAIRRHRPPFRNPRAPSPAVGSA